MQKSDKWIDEILNSTEGMQRAVPDDALYNNILNRLPVKKVSRLVSLRTVSSVAAGLALLLAANIFLIMEERQQPIAQNDGNIEDVVEYYQLNEPFNPYMP